jgi:integrase
MELGAFIAHGAASRPTDHALACLLGLLGLRVSEACGIDIEPQTGGSYIIRPKRGSIGTIPVGDAVVTGLAKHFEDFPPSEDRAPDG